MRHLTHPDVGAKLAAGRDVEQLLSERHEMNQLVICYISMKEINQMVGEVRPKRKWCCHFG